jgi:coproporphyrinogen III oxidase
MSLPSTVRWEYNHQPNQGSEEEKLLEILKKPIDWV